MGHHLTCVVLCLAAAAPAPAATNLTASASDVRAFLGGRTGKLVYVDRNAGRRCYWIDLTDMSVHQLADEENVEEPLFSPDGTRVVYGRTAIVSKWPGQSSGNVGNAYIRSLAGGDRSKVAGASVSGRQAFSPHWWVDPASGDEYIVTMDYFEKDTQSASGRGTWKQKVVDNAPVGAPIKILDHAFDGGLSRDGKRVGEAYHFLHLARTKDLGGGDGWSISSRLTGGQQACNASMSPDNDYYVMHLADGHAGAAIRNGNDTRITWIPKPSGSVEMQHPEYSTDPGFSTFTAQYGSSYRIFIANTSNGASMEIARGDFMHPHLWIGEAEPRMSLSPPELAFQAGVGGANPQAQQVAVANTGADTLAPVSVQSSSAWLTVAVFGDGNGQTIDNRVDINDLDSGTHDATVMVSCANAANSPLTYAVTLVVGAAPELTTVTMSPDRATTVPFGLLDLTASLSDQYGAPITGVVDWTASGGTLVDSAPGVIDATHHATFIADGTEGVVTVTATSGAITDTAEIAIAMSPGLHLPINCGANNLDVDGWERDDSYVSGGEDWTNQDTVSVAGVDGAAPPLLYRSVRHCITATGSCPRFDFADLDDGTYAVHLHFADRYVGPRHIDVTIEGNRVLSNYDISSSAGGTNRAVIETFAVEVADGNGMTIALSSSDGDAFVSGIEIDGAGDSTPPTITITSPADGVSLTGGFTVAGTASDADGIAAVLVQVDDGAVMPASGTELWSFEVDETDLVAGEHELVVRATDLFGNSATESVTVEVVTPAVPEIVVLAPVGGERWTAGTTQRIRWRTVGVDDVTIAYSSGAEYQVIASSVDRGHPEWSNYAWQVPIDPCDECRIKIEGYFREAEGFSGLFAIIGDGSRTEVVPDGDDGLVGGCQQLRGASWLVGLFACLLAVAKRRSRGSQLT